MRITTNLARLEKALATCKALEARFEKANDTDTVAYVTNRLAAAQTAIEDVLSVLNSVPGREPDALRWQPAMYRTNRYDCYADSPAGRYLVRYSGKATRRFTLTRNDAWLGSYASLQIAQDEALNNLLKRSA